MDWSPEQIATLTQLWAEGLSTAEIGRRMSLRKSQVIGKAHRLLLPGRPNPSRFSGAPKPPRPLSGPKIAKPVKVKSAATKENNPTAQEQTATEQRRAYFKAIGTNGHQCTAMLGEPQTPEFKSCTEPALIKRPFCLEHCVAYLRPVRPLLDRSRRPPDPAGIDQG